MPVIDVKNVQPNSHAYKAEKNEKVEREKVKSVVRDGVSSTKKSLGQKFVDAFIKTNKDDIRNYVLKDVIIPAVGGAVLDVVSMMFFGKTNGGYYSGKSSYTSYSSAYKNSGPSKYFYGNDKKYEENKNVDYRNIILNTRRDAESVLDEMHRRIEVYGYVTVAELLQLVDVIGNYTDNNWGWKSHDDIGLQRVGNGFLIKVTEARYVG